MHTSACPGLLHHTCCVLNIVNVLGQLCMHGRHYFTPLHICPTATASGKNAYRPIALALQASSTKT